MKYFCKFEKFGFRPGKSLLKFIAALSIANRFKILNARDYKKRLARRVPLLRGAGVCPAWISGISAGSMVFKQGYAQIHTTFGKTHPYTPLKRGIARAGPFSVSDTPGFKLIAMAITFATF